MSGYSLGMRQRLGLAAALLGDPRVLVLDEPANGLDPAGIHWLRDLLRSAAAEGRAILVSSHVLSEVAQAVDDVVIIRAGRPVMQAPLADLLARSGRSLEQVYLDLTGGIQPATWLRLSAHAGVLTPLGGWVGPDSGRERYDLRAGAALEFHHAER